jgi:hypothetical protein
MDTFNYFAPASDSVAAADAATAADARDAQDAHVEPELRLADYSQARDWASQMWDDKTFLSVRTRNGLKALDKAYRGLTGVTSLLLNDRSLLQEAQGNPDTSYKGLSPMMRECLHDAAAALIDAVDRRLDSLRESDADSWLERNA